MSERQTLLWLDDERDPALPRWHVYFPMADPVVSWVKSYDQFVAWVLDNGLPDAVCFDHDLGEKESGLDAAKWLVAYCLDNDLVLPRWNIQSANPIGKENIQALLQSFEKFNNEG